MMTPRSLLWFARFETRLAWRDLFSMMMAGGRSRKYKIVIGLILLPFFLHGIALLVLHFVEGPIQSDLPTLIAVTATILLSGSAMLAQGMESVTRSFYVRSDLELILSAPVDAGNLFAVRVAALAVPATFMSILVMGPFIDVIAWRNGGQWLSAYGVLIAVSLTTTALAVLATIGLFKLFGPKRTRLVAQIAAAIVGGLFVIGLQVAAMLSTGTVSRLAFLHSSYVSNHVPDIGSLFWLPAKAALGDRRSLIIIVTGSIVLFLIVTARYSSRFAEFAIVASGTSANVVRQEDGGCTLRISNPERALRLKERRLILRDPWLLSQTLMQLLYLVPPALLLWRGFGRGGLASIVLVPVLIMTAGQLAGGLAWLTISGEDAPDLVLSAPVSSSALLRAKIVAVLQFVAVVILPFAALLALISIREAFAVAIAGTAAAASSTTIQLWFRSQAKRSLFRRRHTTSRIAALSEALVSLTWAGAGATSLIGLRPAAVVSAFALSILFAVRAISPASANPR